MASLPYADAPLPPRILLADDNPDNAALIALFLEGAPYRLEKAANGRQAVERHFAAPYDLIFMDLEMPGMDGYEATRAIQAREREEGRPAVPILALTAHALTEHRERCRQAGFTAFLVKPVRRASILTALAEHLGPPTEASRPSAPEPTAAAAPDRERLRSILPIFCNTCEESLAAVEQALVDDDMEVVRREGHRIKGSARSFGFPELGQAGEDLERAGGRGDAPAARTALKQARDRLAQAKKELAGDAS